MSVIEEFQGFSEETVRFFRNLKRNNNKVWFDNHRERYESAVLEPAEAFVRSMGSRIRRFSPGIMAIPKVNGSLFRIYRDTRFSVDKSPYKTNMGIYFWDGNKPRMESSGYYFHLEPPHMLLGVGMYMFPKSMLDIYRKAVISSESGRSLTRIIKRIHSMPGIEIGGKYYKRIPPGYDMNHPNAELLLHNGLHAGMETRIPEEFYSKDLLDYCEKYYKTLEPLHRWLVEINGNRN